MQRMTLLATVLGSALLAGCGGAATSGPATPSTTPIGGSTTGAGPGGTGAGSTAAAGATPVAPESAPPGDIPDSIAFVPYTSPAGHYTFSHPEGWAQSGQGTSVRFTDKLNSVQANTGPATAPPTEQSANAKDVPSLRSAAPAFELRGVSAVTTPYGAGVKIVYRRNSDPNAVTGKVYRNEVERYELVHAGQEVVLELSGPVGADNVDAYATMVKSLVPA